MQIREAGFDDVDAMAILLGKLFALERDFSADTACQRRGLLMLLGQSSAVVLVAEYDGVIVGMVTGQLLISTAEGAVSLLVEDLVVDECWRGRGIGAFLLDEVGRWGDGCGARRMQLLADRTNTNALHFYDHVDWQVTNLICLRRYYRHE